LTTNLGARRNQEDPNCDDDNDKDIAILPFILKTKSFTSGKKSVSAIRLFSLKLRAYKCKGISNCQKQFLNLFITVSV
jgi:hypothetical protein